MFKEDDGVNPRVFLLEMQEMFCAGQRNWDFTIFWWYFSFGFNAFYKIRFLYST